MTGAEIVEEAHQAFEEWLSRQPEGVQELSLLEQIEAYARASEQEGEQ